MSGNGRAGDAVARWRLGVLCIGALTTTLKLLVAASTFGTNDVHSWIDFAGGVRDYGAIGIYGHGHEFFTLYNHPPLSGWLLVGVNWLVDHGVAGVPFLIRVPACLADLVTGVLVFELVRRWRSVREAAIAGALVALSPALFIVSGFHGNTDPVFVMFTLLSVYLVAVGGDGPATRRSTLAAAAAGFAFVAAISVKLVPVVVLPALVVALARGGWRRVAWFAAGGALLFLPLWGPVLVTHGPEFRQDVLGYAGVGPGPWGLMQFAYWAGALEPAADLLGGPLRFVVLLICAGLPALLVWRRALGVAPAAGVALALFLLLLPTFGMQYVVWPLAAAYLVNATAATAYNVTTGGFTLVVYDHWNRAYPWNWDEAVAMILRPKELVLMVLSWSALAAVVAVGLWRLWRAAAPTDGSTPRPDAEQLAARAAAGG